MVGSRNCPNPQAPTVLLYAHYDVQPPLDDTAWHNGVRAHREGRTLVWTGYGRLQGQRRPHDGAARPRRRGAGALKLVVEGSEEQGTGGLEAFVPDHADLLRANAILVCDTGNAAVGC